jgi:Cu/Ag efflux pump CusA
VTYNVTDRDLGSVAREIEASVCKLTFPQGYHPEFFGEYSARQESQRQLLLLAGLVVLGILVLLHVEFQSWRLTWLISPTFPALARGSPF